MNEYRNEQGLSHFDLARRDISNLTDTDLCIVFIQSGYRECSTLMREFLLNATEKPAWNLTFLMQDLGKTDEEKKQKLRVLKGMLETYGSKADLRILVKGKSLDEKKLEPNVFSSDVKFELVAN